MKHKQLYKKAQSTLKKGQVEQALDLFEQAARQAEKIGDTGVALESLQEAHILAKEQGDPEHAIDLLEQALLLAEPLKDVVLQGSLHNNLAMTYQYRGQASQAVEQLTHAIELLEEASAPIELADVYNNLGFVERERGNLSIAQHYHEKAMAISESQENKSGVARSRLELGIVHKDLGHLTEAHTHLEHALALFRREQDFLNGGHTLIALGLTASLMHNIEEAHQYYMEALSSYRTVGDRENEALTLHNLGQLYDNAQSSEEDFAVALNYYRASLKVNTAIRALPGIVEDIGAIASLYQAQGDYEQAQGMHEQLLYMYTSMNFRRGQVDTLIDLGILAREKQDFEGAEHQLTEALRFAKEIDNPRLIYEVYVDRGDIYLLAGEFQKAATDFALALTYTESIRASILLEREALDYFAKPQLEAYDRLIRLYARVLHDPLQAQLYVEKAKSREFLRRLRLSDLLLTQQAPHILVQQEKHLLQQLREAVGMLETDDTPNHLSALNNYHRTEKELRVVWSEMEQFDSAYANLRRGEPVSWEELKTCLQQ